MRSTVTRRVRRAALVICAVFLAACGGGSSTTSVEFRIPVEVEEVGKDSVEDRIVTTGTLRTRESVVLSVETPGFLVLGKDTTGQRLVEGSRVVAGQLIAQITGEDARLAARLEATRQHLEVAKRELDRREQLYEQQLVAEADVWQARSRYEDALHDYETSQRTFEKARIVTPIAGVVLALARDANGRPMADGQKVLQGFEVARIGPIDSLIADIDLVGPELARVRPGQDVRIGHYAFENTTLPGSILRLSPTMDALTHTFRAEVEVNNAEGLLRPGMFIEATIIADSREDVPVVPRESVTQRSGRSVVFVVDGQRAVLREVALGLGDDDQVEVREGIQPGERVVVRGLETLTDGTRVRVIGT